MKYPPGKWTDMATRVYVAGHRGLVGSALVRLLARQDDVELVLRTRSELDLTCQPAVCSFFKSEKPDHVYVAAAKVGGILANSTYPAQFIRDNLLIQTNVIHSAHLSGVQKLVFLGSSCIYPRLAPQPIRESFLLDGHLEATNEPYAIAKIAGIKLCESYNREYGRDYRSVMPTNLYGPCDDFWSDDSHVIPALMRRFHDAVRSGSDEVVVWGSGSPHREFLHVDDLARACVHVMQLPKASWSAHTEPMLSHVNVGSGSECTIRQLAEMIAEISGFQGRLRFDESKPDGTPRKLLDTSRLDAMGWRASIGLKEGLSSTYRWYLDQHVDGAERKGR